jgi:hypothetical protein
MAAYLEKFKSTISQAQLNKLLQVLDTQKKQGSFTSVAQFKAKIDATMRTLFEKRISPLLNIFLAIPGLTIDSETYNFMLDRIQDDLEIAFQEAVNVDEILAGHQGLVQDVILRNLKHAVADLENRVEIHEALVSSSYGFHDALVSNFSGALNNRLSRTTANAGLFFDPRTGENLDASMDAAVDQIGKSLTLAKKITGYIPINAVRQVFDGEAIAGEVDVTLPSLKLQNMLDATKGTFWGAVYLFEENVPTEVITKLEFDFGGAQAVNFLEIEPALISPVLLTKLSFSLNNSTINDVDLEETIGNNRVRIYFNKTTADKATLTFENTNYSRQQYGVENPSLSIANVVSVSVSEQLGLVQETVPFNFVGRQFQIGFDNVRVGLAEHYDTGLFISSPLALPNPATILGLTSSELRPTASNADLFNIDYADETYDLASTTMCWASIEYWVLRNVFNDRGSLIASDVFPILPLSTEGVNHERLLLTHRYGTDAGNNDAGKLMFYTTIADGDIRVYRNGIEIVYNNMTEGWVEEPRLTNLTVSSGTPMTFGIRLTAPLAGAIYTVSYTPIISNTKFTSIPTGSESHQTLVDLVGDLTARSYSEQLVLSSDVKNGDAIAATDLYLMVLLRRNTLDASVSPVVKKFMLSVGTPDRNEI